MIFLNCGVNYARSSGSQEDTVYEEHLLKNIYKTINVRSATVRKYFQDSKSLQNMNQQRAVMRVIGGRAIGSVVKVNQFSCYNL